MTGWTTDEIPDQAGRRFIITGANSGLGYETARQVAGKGGHVVLTARDQGKGEAAVARLRREHPDASVELGLLDLADLDSVHSFAATVVAPVDVLVNNAGVMMPPRSLTKQGFELQFATNHLGHFALTGLLMDHIGEAAAARGDARVVTVSSALHRRGSIHFDDLTGERSYSPTGFYAQSKFANILFGLELDRRLRSSGVPIRSVLAHPGYAATNLQAAGPTGLMKSIMKVTNVVMAQSVEKGALSQLYAATAPEAEGGQYIGPDGRGEQRGFPKVVQPIDAGRDPETARRLWSLSEELTGVKYHFAGS
jgi:NAD(P)-dependent dehydrogenase (short-subunit alcohol dehydrogenase family)